MNAPKKAGAGQLAPDQAAFAPAPEDKAPDTGLPQLISSKPSLLEPVQPKPRPAEAHGERRQYGMAPLIRGTLVGLYLALVVPLPVLASGGLRPVLALAVPLGLLLVLAITSETVTVEAQGLSVGQPAWCGWLLRRGWSLTWPEITGLTAVATSQGGRVFYLRSAKGSYLLPQRVARFDDFLAQLQLHSGLDIAGIGRLSPPWTYQLLAGLTTMMLLGELVALLVQKGQNLAL